MAMISDEEAHGRRGKQHDSNHSMPLLLPLSLANSRFAAAIRSRLEDSFGIKHLSRLQHESIAAVGRMQSVVVNAPTGAGKSLVSELAVAQCTLCSKKLAIVVVPFVALVQEQAQRLRGILPDAVKVQTVSGAAAQPRIRAGEAIVCTIERASSIISLIMGKKKLKQLGLVVVDELHMVGDPRRGPKLEVLLAKLLMARRANTLGGAGSSDDTVDHVDRVQLAASALFKAPGTAAMSDEEPPAPGAGTGADQKSSSHPAATETEPLAASQRPDQDAIQIVGLSATMPNRETIASWLGAILVPAAGAPPVARPVRLTEYVVLAGDGLQPMVRAGSLPNASGARHGQAAAPRQLPAADTGTGKAAKRSMPRTTPARKGNGWGMQVLKLTEVVQLQASGGRASGRRKMPPPRRMIACKELSEQVGRNPTLPMEVQGLLHDLDKDGWMRVTLFELLQDRRVVIFCSNPSQTTSAARSLGRVLAALERQSYASPGAGAAQPQGAVLPTSVPKPSLASTAASSSSGNSMDTSAYSSASQAMRGLARSDAAARFGTTMQDPVTAAQLWSRYRKAHRQAADRALAQVLCRSAQPVPRDRQQLLELGVGVHNGELGDDQREAIETCFKEGQVRCLIATSTVSAGVNLPADTVVVRCPSMPTEAGIRPISTERYLQMVGRAGRQGLSTEGRSYLIPFRGKCPTDFASCVLAARKWSQGKPVVENVSAVARASTGQWRGDWSQVCGLIDRLFVLRGMTPVESGLDGPQSASAGSRSGSSSMRRHSVASPKAGPGSPAVAVDEVEVGLALHLLELIAAGVVETTADCNAFLQSTLLHAQRPADAQRCLARSLDFLLSYQFAIPVALPAATTEGVAVAAAGGSHTGAEQSPSAPAGADRKFVICATRLGHACASSGLPPLATIRVAEELSECMQVGIPPASDVFCLFILLGQCELVLRNAGRDAVIKAAKRMCQSARRKAESALASWERGRVSLQVPAIAGAEHLDAIRGMDGRFTIGAQFMASFLVDGALRLLRVPSVASAQTPLASARKGTSAQVAMEPDESSPADSERQAGPDQSSSSSASDAENVRSKAEGDVMRHRWEPASMENAARHARDRPFHATSVFAPRSSYQARLYQVRYFFAELVHQLTQGADPFALCDRWGLPRGLLSKLWHDLSTSSRQVLQVAKGLGYDLLHAALSRMNGRLSKGAVGPQLTLLRQLPSLRRHFASQLAKAGIKDAAGVLEQPVEKLAEILRRALPYASAATPAAGPPGVGQSVSGGQSAGWTTSATAAATSSSTAGSSNRKAGGDDVSPQTAGGDGAVVSRDTEGQMWEQLVQLACMLQTEAKQFASRRAKLGIDMSVHYQDEDPGRRPMPGGDSRGQARPDTGSGRDVGAAVADMNAARARWLAARQKQNPTASKQAEVAQPLTGAGPSQVARPVEALARGSSSRAPLNASRIAKQAGLDVLLHRLTSLPVEQSHGAARVAAPQGSAQHPGMQSSQSHGTPAGAVQPPMDEDGGSEIRALEAGRPATARGAKRPRAQSPRDQGAMSLQFGAPGAESDGAGPLGAGTEESMSSIDPTELLALLDD